MADSNGSFFEDVWKRFTETIRTEIQDLSYMEIVTGVSDKVDGHIDGDAWDILQGLRRAKLPENAEKEGITQSNMLKIPDNVTILARTRIELDGDVFFLLYGQDGKPLPLSQEAMELHKMGINTSIENWHYFLRFILELTATVGAIVGNKDVDVDRVQKLMSKQGGS